MSKIFGLIGLLAAAYGTVGDIEILLLIISVIGFLFSAYNVKESWKDWKYLKSQGKTDHGPHYSPRFVVALNGLRAEAGRAIIQTYFITLAVFAMTIPETPPYIHQPLKLVLFGFIFRWGFIISSIILSLKSYWGYQVRKRVNEHYDDGNDTFD